LASVYWHEINVINALLVSGLVTLNSFRRLLPLADNEFEVCLLGDPRPDATAAGNLWVSWRPALQPRLIVLPTDGALRKIPDGVHYSNGFS